jgi:hypothetical protein
MKRYQVFLKLAGNPIECYVDVEADDEKGAREEARSEAERRGFPRKLLTITHVIPLGGGKKR